MEFRLTYEGKLVSTRGKPEPGQIDSRRQHKHEIRKHFHKQLRMLWQQHPALVMWSGKGDDPGIQGNPDELSKIRKRYETPTFGWVPLVTPELKLNCKLDILYLRNGARGSVLSTADIDNRVKTLIDALKIPGRGEIDISERPEPDEDPFFVLLSDDSLVTHLSVESDMLLSPTDTKLQDVDSRVVVTVKVWAYSGTWGNLALGV